MRDEGGALRDLGDVGVPDVHRHLPHREGVGAGHLGVARHAPAVELAHEGPHQDPAVLARQLWSARG